MTTLRRQRGTAPPTAAESRQQSADGSLLFSGNVRRRGGQSRGKNNLCPPRQILCGHCHFSMCPSTSAQFSVGVEQQQQPPAAAAVVGDSVRPADDVYQKQHKQQFVQQRKAAFPFVRPQNGRRRRRNTNCPPKSFPLLLITSCPVVLLHHFRCLLCFLIATLCVLGASTAPSPNGIFDARTVAEMLNNRISVQLQFHRWAMVIDSNTNATSHYEPLHWNEEVFRIPPNAIRIRLKCEAHLSTFEAFVPLKHRLKVLWKRFAEEGPSDEKVADKFERTEALLEMDAETEMLAQKNGTTSRWRCLAQLPLPPDGDASAVAIGRALAFKRGGDADGIGSEKHHESDLEMKQKEKMETEDRQAEEFLLILRESQGKSIKLPCSTNRSLAEHPKNVRWWLNGRQMRIRPRTQLRPEPNLSGLELTQSFLDPETDQGIYDCTVAKEATPQGERVQHILVIVERTTTARLEQVQVQLEHRPKRCFRVHFLQPNGTRLSDAYQRNYFLTFYRLDGPLRRVIGEQENAAGDQQKTSSEGIIESEHYFGERPMQYQSEINSHAFRLVPSDCAVVPRSAEGNGTGEGVGRVHCEFRCCQSETCGTQFDAGGTKYAFQAAAIIGTNKIMALSQPPAIVSTWPDTSNIRSAVADQHGQSEEEQLEAQRESDQLEIDQRKSDQPESDQRKTDQREGDQTEIDQRRSDQPESDQRKSDQRESDQTEIEKSDQSEIDQRKTDQTEIGQRKSDQRPWPIICEHANCRCDFIAPAEPSQKMAMTVSWESVEGTETATKKTQFGRHEAREVWVHYTLDETDKNTLSWKSPLLSVDIPPEAPNRRQIQFDVEDGLQLFPDTNYRFMLEASNHHKKRNKMPSLKGTYFDCHISADLDLPPPTNFEFGPSHAEGDNGTHFSWIPPQLPPNRTEFGGKRIDGFELHFRRVDNANSSALWEESDDGLEMMTNQSDFHRTIYGEKADSFLLDEPLTNTYQVWLCSHWSNANFAASPPSLSSCSSRLSVPLIVRPAASVLASEEDEFHLPMPTVRPPPPPPSPAITASISVVSSSVRPHIPLYKWPMYQLSVLLLLVLLLLLLLASAVLHLHTVWVQRNWNWRQFLNKKGKGNSKSSNREQHTWKEGAAGTEMKPIIINNNNSNHHSSIANSSVVKQHSRHLQNGLHKLLARRPCEGVALLQVVDATHLEAPNGEATKGHLLDHSSDFSVAAVEHRVVGDGQPTPNSDKLRHVQQQHQTVVQVENDIVDNEQTPPPQLQQPNGPSSDLRFVQSLSNFCRVPSLALPPIKGHCRRSSAPFAAFSGKEFIPTNHRRFELNLSSPKQRSADFVFCVSPSASNCPAMHLGHYSLPNLCQFHLLLAQQLSSSSPVCTMVNNDSGIAIAPQDNDGGEMAPEGQNDDGILSQTHSSSISSSESADHKEERRRRNMDTMAKTAAARAKKESLNCRKRNSSIATDESHSSSNSNDSSRSDSSRGGGHNDDDDAQHHHHHRQHVQQLSDHSSAFRPKSRTFPVVISPATPQHCSYCK